MRSMRGRYLAAASIGLAMLTSCHIDDDEGEGPAELRLPMHFELAATASATEGEFTVNCSLGFVVEISGEVSRTSEVVEYIATMGGEAVRDIQREDGSGVVLSGFAYYPNLQVLHILPDRVQLVSLDFPPDGPSTGSRFWDELRFFDGVLDDDGTITGEWLCAPLDVEQGGINDDSIFADGTWTTTEIPG
jgi:hypothetical protein